MRFLYIILSIYLVALSCLPCADMEVDTAAFHSKDLATSHDSHSHDKENDLCSPFCVCNCCGTQFASFLTTMFIDFPSVTNVIKTKQSIYKPTFTSNFYGSIWQPPQIA